MSEQNTILKVLIGSQAHGLANEDSDFDYRGVFVVPTTDILKIGSKVHSTSWIEGKDDDTSWEIGHFLNLATKCNPTILEVFFAPITESTELGIELRSLFPYVWNADAVVNAFVGYGLNQRKKFLDQKDSRPGKYACAYLRTLYQAWELLRTGQFTVKVSETEIGNTLKKWRKGQWTFGEVIQICHEWEQKVRAVHETLPIFERKETDVEKINKFLIKVRQINW